MYTGIFVYTIEEKKIMSKCEMTFLDESLCFKLDYENKQIELFLENDKSKFKILNKDANAFKKDFILHENQIFITGSLLFNDSNTKIDFLININNINPALLEKYNKWEIFNKQKSSLIEIIKYNYRNNYNQGEFANNISRKDLYEMSENIKKENPEDIKFFLIKALRWGDYDKVVAKPHGNPMGDLIIETYTSKKYYENYIKLFDEEKTSIEKIYNSFKYKKTLSITNIGPAYFTKFLHFYSFGKDTKLKMLILDKWSILAWVTLMIEENKSENYEFIQKSRLIYLDKKGKLTTKLNPTGKEYSQFNEYIFKIAQSNMIKPNKFEELMFGWEKDLLKNGFTNPRLHNIEICTNWLNNNQHGM
jgi:hypothetical protein